MNNISNVDETKKRICDAFLELYADNDIEKITIKMISEKAEISRSTFYTHFMDIYDLFSQIETTFFDELKAHLIPGVPRILSGENLMNIIPDSDFYEKYKMEFKLFIGTYGKSNVPERIKEIIRGAFRDIITKQKADVPPITFYILEYMMNAQLGTFSYWFKNNFDINFDEIKYIMYKSMNEGPLTYAKSLIFNQDADNQDGNKTSPPDVD